MPRELTSPTHHNQRMVNNPFKRSTLRRQDARRDLINKSTATDGTSSSITSGEKKRVLSCFRRKSKISEHDHISDATDSTAHDPLDPFALEDLSFDDATCTYENRTLLFLQETIPKRRRFLLGPSQKEKLKACIHEDFTDILLQDAGSRDVEVHTAAADHLLSQFASAVEFLREQTTTGTLTDMIFQIMQEYIHPRLVLDDPSPADAAHAASWIDGLLQQAQVWDVTIDESWETDLERLVAVYLQKGVHGELGDLLPRSLDLVSPQDVRANDQGHLVTGWPEQVSYMIEQQLSLARQILPKQYLARVLDACNQEIRQVLWKLVVQVGVEWNQMGTSRFCALINDTSRLSEFCDAYNEAILDTEEQVATGEGLSRDLTELSLHATSFLCERIMLALKEPKAILSSVGDAAWESSQDASPVEVSVATFQDYFTDIEQWLASDYYYPKVLKNCFDMTLEVYLASFFSNTMIHCVCDPTAVAEEIRQDYLRLVVFFNGPVCDQYHGVAGFYDSQTINKRLALLQSVSRIIDSSNDPDTLEHDAQTLLIHLDCGDGGTPAVLHLVGLRKRHNGPESAEWLRVIAAANKSIDPQSDEESYSYTIPDVRNSKQLRNIRPRQRDLERQLSISSQSIALSTNRYLKGDGFGVRMYANLARNAWNKKQ